MQTNENKITETAQSVLGQVRRVIVGKDQALLWVMAAILSGGHILLEDIPGVGKTTMAVAFSKVMGLRCNRVQFTPDVLPSDVTGYSVLDQASGKMVYQPGAVLCNLFLADELNRATSRTQSALLEAMEEGQVTVDGVRHEIPRPFIVIATQNPTGAAGTQLLPDSQMDRFSVCLSMGYPEKRDEVAMVLRRQKVDPMKELTPVVTREELVHLQDLVAKTYISTAVVQYIVELVSATRKHPELSRGASPRGTLAVTAMAKSIAQLQGRDFVTPEDVKTVFADTLAHRLLLSPSAEESGITAKEILDKILASVKAPSVD
jgi:MoxR-like ATPase